MTPGPVPRVLADARRHWAILCVLAVAAALMLTGLGRDHLWADEGDTAVLGRSILQFGVPTAWDGVTFTDSDYGTRLTDDFVMVSHPWAQYYAVAAAFAVAGESAFAARLPFAISAWLTVVLVYLVLLECGSRRATAISAAALVTLSVQFLLYARQSRQYTLNAALTCLVVLLFLRLRSWPRSLAFGAAAVLLFHTHPGGIAVVAALGAMTIVHRPFASQRKWFWLAAPGIAGLTLPWVLLASGGYTQNTTPMNAIGEVWARLAQYAVESVSVTPLIGALVIYVAARLRWPRAQTAPARKSRRVAAVAGPASERSLALAILLIITAYAVVLAVTQSAQDTWVIGLRGTPAVIPFAAMLAAMAVEAASRDRWPVWLALMTVLSVTRLGDVTPWTSWYPATAVLDKNSLVTFHTPVGKADRFLHTDVPAFLSSLLTPEPGVVARITEVLRRDAKPGEVVVTNYEWEPLYFHTRLPLGMTVLPNYPIYPAVRRRELPSYVYEADGVRWIVWRRAWGAYRGQACDQLLKTLDANGIPIVLVAEIPETTWENRENIHFRRFPRNRHLYGWFENVPSTLVFRVDWPAGSGQAGPR